MILSCRIDVRKTNFSHQLLSLIGDEAVFLPGLQHLIVPLKYVMIIADVFKGIHIVPLIYVMNTADVFKGIHIVAWEYEMVIADVVKGITI